jgi:opacity protein-like surface antigen
VRTILTSLAVLTLMPITIASAADMPLKAPPMPYAAYNWTAFYAGGEFGGGWATEQVTHVEGGTSFPSGWVDNRIDFSGVLGGLYAGYNYQINHLVVGIDGDYTWANLKGAGTDVSPVDGHIAHYSASVHWISTVTARLGYANNNWLFFAKGGWALAGFSDSSVQNSPSGALAHLTTGVSDRGGWTVGGGIEWGFAAHWSAKLEYDFVNFDTASYNETEDKLVKGVISFPTRSATSSLNMLKGGVAYRF